MENTGYKSFTFLEKYFIDDNTPTGETKPNVATDPDYIAPFLDTVSCPPVIRYYNTKQSKTVTKNNCDTGYSGSNVTLTADANHFVSYESLADANNQAITWLENNAQIYANTKGTCELLDDTSPGGNCFVEGTLITLPDGSEKAIEELHLNQLLLSSKIETLIDTNNASELYKWSSKNLLESRITSPITKIVQKDTYKTIIINNGLLEATPTHLQLIQRNGFWKFIPLGDIQVGDNLYTIDSKIIPVTSTIINLEKRKIYPLTLNPFHTYFANGILTHNFKEQEPNS